MKSNTDMNLAKKIRQIRIDNNLTQEQVAKALDATPGYICNVENGRTAMSLRMLVYFAKLTNTTLDSLVGCMDETYTTTALDHEIMELIASMPDSDKRKLIETLRIWMH